MTLLDLAYPLILVVPLVALAGAIRESFRSSGTEIRPNEPSYRRRADVGPPASTDPAARPE